MLGGQNGHKRLRMTRVCGCQWPVTALGMNSRRGQLGTALGYNGERRNPLESSCYLLNATIEASVREKADEILERTERGNIRDICGEEHNGWFEMLFVFSSHFKYNKNAHV